MARKKLLKDDFKHLRDTHERWLEKYPRNRSVMSPDYKEEWNLQQCFACQFYINLEGAFSKDWGVCSNPASPHDGKIMFEHDGCEFNLLAEDEEDF